MVEPGTKRAIMLHEETISHNYLNDRSATDILTATGEWLELACTPEEYNQFIKSARGHNY